MQAKRILKVAAKSVFALVDPLFGPFPGPRILIYHQVGVNFGREMEVSIDTFRRQLDWMQAHGEIVDLETAIERRGEPDADKLFVLTFDDGFEDVYHNAFPLLKERALPFTLYLTTNPIETGEPLDPRYPEAKPLTWDQISEMVGTRLVTVGAHTHTHPDLTKAQSSLIERELDMSNRVISERTGIQPLHFTYPWGWWSPDADALIRGRYASATLGDSKGDSHADIYRIARIPVQQSDGIFFFRRKATHGLRLEAKTRQMLHARRRGMIETTS